MVIQMMNKIFHNRRLRSGLRRGLAAAVCVALLLPILPNLSTLAADSKLFPVKVATPDEFPHIEVEGNFVRDEFGFLTGYYEMGLRVRTPEDGSFMGLGVVLEYDTSILTPVNWEQVGADVAISNTGYYNVQLPTQKLASISTATAHSGIPAPAGGTATPDSTKALMSFVVNSYGKAEFPGDPADPDATTLAVVRFRVNKNVMENVSITKTASGDYDVKYGDKKVADVESLYNQMQLVSPSVAVRVMGFASDADIKKSGDESKKLDVHMALDYMAGYTSTAGKMYTNEYYHIPAYDPNDSLTYETGAAAVEVIEGKTHSFDRRPKTENNRIMAVDPNCSNPDTATAWGAGKFSYVSNLMVNKEPGYVVVDGSGNPADNYITFPIVSKRSFTDQSDILGNLTTIVYVDWDNTLLGTQVVPKNVDVRQLVSDHVAKNFIYHDDNPATYGPNDLNNPLAADPANPEKVVSSLKRVDSYRGKYIANGPAAENAADDGTIVADGSLYPLTNKLDYVFLKRPMTHTKPFTDPEPDPDTYPGGVTDSGYIADLAAYKAAYQAWYWGKTEWSQQTDDDTGAVVWDTERPYAYGWAECDITNYEDVWTTLGMGELGSNAAVTEAGANGTTKGYNGANLGGYKAIPTTSIASVTYDGDADFAFADLSKGFDKDMVFLKAVYEPGEGLLTRSISYRMIKAPYYNKFNNKAANDGGAYSVTVTYERAAEDTDGTLHGVARIREPVARQDTTTDLRWEESTTPPVNHNLTNPTWSETYQDKNKTTYTKVDVPNTEEITLEMAFSARQNKADFFLSENYESNFVVAGARTVTNSLRDFEEYAADNYNYYVNDTGKIPAIYYTPTAYGDREGTYGFVLFGTLNYLMEQATGYAHGTVTTNDFYDTVANTLTDANLMNSSGNPIVDYSDIIATMEVLKKAAEDAEAKRYDTDAADYWNEERGCAELSYHQLQHYMNGKGLLSRSAADGDKIKWCHLHTDCAALLSGKPLTWPDLIQTAKDKNNTNIEKLTIQEIETNFHLRTDGAGGTSWTPTNFAAQVIDAVEKLMDSTNGGPGIAQADITWDQVQYVIDKGAADLSDTDMNDYGAEHYWWYDGKGLDDNLAAGETVFDRVKLAADAAHAAPEIAQTLPDGRAVAERKAKLNQVRPAFPADANEPSADWIKFTENLTMGQDPADASKVVAFADFDDFVTKFVDAVHTTTTAATWTAVQAEILGESTPATDYWWHNGGVNITDLASLLKAAKKGGNAWSGVDFTLFSSLNLKLAADLKGTAIDSSSFATVKTAIFNYARTPNVDLTNDAWDSVQSAIINGTYNEALRDAEKDYFWWKDGTKTQPDFTPSGGNAEAKAKDMAKLLSDAYFKVNFNGYDATAWDTLTETALAAGRLVKSQTGSETAFTALGQLTAADVSTVIGAVGTLFAAANGGAGKLTYSPSPIPDKPYTPIDWTDLQAAILNDSTANPEYWWMKADTKANPPSVDFTALQTALQAYAASRTPANLTALKAAFTADKIANMGFVRASQPTTVAVPAATINNINNRWAQIVSSSAAANLGTTPVTWDQVEYLCLMAISNTYRIFPSAQATTQVTNRNITRPDWVTAGGYSLRPTMNMSMISPERQLEEQAEEAKELLTTLAEALAEDPALAAKLGADADNVAALKVLAKALGYELTSKTGEKVPGTGTYSVDNDVKVYPTEEKSPAAGETQTSNTTTAGEATSSATTGETTSSTTEETTSSVTAGEAGTSTAGDKESPAEDKKTNVNDTAAENGQEQKQEVTDVDGTSATGDIADATEEKKQSETAPDGEETGQGGGSAADTSPSGASGPGETGVDPPPDGEPPKETETTDADNHTEGVDNDEEV